MLLLIFFKKNSNCQYWGISTEPVGLYSKRRSWKSFLVTTCRS